MSSDRNLTLPAIAEKVEEIWKDVLSVPHGHDDATFFELSGESISAVRIVSRVEEELGIGIEVGDIFEEDPTMAAFVRTVTAKAETSSR